VNKAVEYFQQAIDKDPNYALAYAGIADSYLIKGGFFYSAPPTELYPKAKDAAVKALAIDDQLAEAHTSLAWVKTQYDWQWADAETEFKQAIALKPNYPTAHHWYGFFLVSMRRFDEAIAEIKRAQELDPVSLIISTDVGAILFMSHRDDQAIEQCEKTLELDPNFIQAHNILSLIYGHRSMYDQWLAERQKVLTLSGKSVDAASLGRIYAQSGYRGVMEDQLVKLKQRAKSHYVQAFAMAVAYADLGDNDRAFEWLEKAYQERSPRMADIRVSRAAESLRADPRFPAFVRRIGLEP
jgi:Tfp pilus assembly protein PilF